MRGGAEAHERLDSRLVEGEAKLEKKNARENCSQRMHRKRTEHHGGGSGNSIAHSAASIRCTGVEEFSRRGAGKKTWRKKDLRAQQLGDSEKGTVFATNGFEHKKNCREEIMTIDPVCGAKLEEGKAEAQTQFAGKKYFFCSEDCRKEFEANPDEFVESLAA